MHAMLQMEAAAMPKKEGGYFSTCSARLPRAKGNKTGALDYDNGRVRGDTI